MAEIHVERKNYRLWLWLLLGLSAIILGSCLVAWWRGDTSDGASYRAPAADVSAAAGTTGAASGPGGAVAAYLSYVEENRARQAAGPAHEYTADGLRRLAAGIREVAERNAPSAEALRAELDALRAQADSLQRNPQSREHARYAREAFRTAASLMSALQQRHYPKDRYPNLAADVAQVRFAAEAVLAARPLLEQTADVQRFFDQSATALRAMARPDA